MGYELTYYKIDLDELCETLPINKSSEKCSDVDQLIIKGIESLGEYVDAIEHGSGSGALFEKYIKTIAGDYFGLPQIFELMMSRKDIFPAGNDLELGYLRLEEIEQMIEFSKTKKASSYFLENDDFEMDLEIMETVFDVAAKEKKDLLCFYS